MSETNPRLRRIRTLTLILGTILAVFFILAFVPKLIMSMGETQATSPLGGNWEGQVMTAVFLIYMVGYGIGWWKRLWGGILMLLAAVVQMGPFIIIASNFGSLIFGIPILVVGILYIRLDKFEKQLKTQS